MRATPRGISSFLCELGPPEFHAAGRNVSDAVRRSLVFICRAADNEPIPETRSAACENIPLARPSVR